MSKMESRCYVLEMLTHINSQIIAIIVGVLMLIASFAMIRSVHSSKEDHDFALILLILGVLVIGYGIGLINIENIKSIIPKSDK